ncbi:hypothetical protein Tco_0752245 [Tanacetum coccineum]|uniref:Uncharacterized protein n=1 Tax=Tanacetum coccineum TaxID=301880 RepID=A0ABQ4Z697_9ASTR
MPHDSPLPGGHTPGSDRAVLHELMILCTKLSNKVDSLETELKQTKQTYGAALTKLIKKVKKLEQTVKTSQARRRANILGVLSVAKVLADAAKKNVNTNTRRRRAVSTGSEGVSTASRIFSTAEESVSTVGASMPFSTAGMVQQVNIIIPSSSEITKTIKDKGKAIMQESEQPKKIKKKVQIQMSLDEELAQKLHKEEQVRFNAEQEAKGRKGNLSIEERERLLAELIDKRKKLLSAQRYEAIRNKPQTMSQQRKTMCTYMKNMAGYKMEHFKGKSFYEVKEMFDNVYKQVTSFVPMDSVMEKERTKRAGLNLQEESSKRQKTGEGSEPTEELKADEISQEDLQQMIMVVPVEEVYVEALQVKYPIIDWEVYSEDTRKYWKIIRVGNHTEAYQTFDDMLKKFDRDDLDKLWSLVKERFSSTDPTDDKERTLWVELKRLFEPDTDDILWKLQRYMHDPLTWRLYDTCGVHHVSTDRGHDIFMLVEKDYPLTRGLLTLMLCNKLQVDQYSEMADELLRKIVILANRPRQ